MAKKNTKREPKHKAESAEPAFYLIAESLKQDWDRRISHREIARIVRLCGPVASDLAEFATMVLGAARDAQTAPDRIPAWRGRLLASVKARRADLERAVGVGTARIFYEDFIHALAHYDNMGWFVWRLSKLDAEQRIAELLREWHDRTLSADRKRTDGTTPDSTNVFKQEGHTRTVYFNRQRDDGGGKGGEKGPGGNVDGMSWREAEKKAEKYVKNRGYPGHKALAREIGCSPKTLQKARGRSKVLQNAHAKLAAERRRPKRVESAEDGADPIKSAAGGGPELTDAEVDEALERMVKRAPAVSRQELCNNIAERDADGRKELAKAWIAQRHDQKQDDPRTRVPRRSDV